jgi:hypothetical protein
MNRRHLLQSLATLGLVAATPEPVRRYWALDRTMVPDTVGLVYPSAWSTERYDASMTDWRKEFVAWEARVEEIGQPHPERVIFASEQTIRVWDEIIASSR